MTDVRIRVAKIVAKHWALAAIEWGDLQVDGRTLAHPLGLVVDALNGERDPANLGIETDHPDAEKIRALTR